MAIGQGMYSRLGRRTLMESDRLPTAGTGFIHHNNKICQVSWPYDRFYSWPPPPLKSHFWETLEAGAKKWFFPPFWLLWSNNLGTSEIENDKKSVGKLNYCSRSNQWCNRHVNRLQHIDLAKLQRSVGMLKWHFFVILVILGSKLGHFAFEIWPKIHEIIKLELKS